MTRRERLEHKLEKRQDWAEKADARASQAFARADQISERFAGGQPILVGHHSEQGARADQRRMHNAMDRGLAETDMAEHHRSAASGLAAQLERSVFSDDDDAIAQLKTRIAERQAEVDRCKQINQQIRKGPGWEARITPPLTTGEKTDLIQLAQTWARLYKGYPPYHLSNLNSNIRRDKARIEEIKARQARTEKAEAAGGVLIEGDEWVRVTFDEKPERSIIDALKAAGFRWGAGSWIGQRARLPEGIA